MQQGQSIIEFCNDEAGIEVLLVLIMYILLDHFSV